jgi:toxin-antitoxin system PIN domain toxin
MRALLDVNVLIALLDGAHVHNATASRWLDANLEQGWASCPITQNGCVRIMSTDSYPNTQPVAAVMERVRAATSTYFHEFWPDEISVLDPLRFKQDRWLTSRQITDAYLLGLAVHRQGVLVTLDRNVDLSLVQGAERHHLLVI